MAETALEDHVVALPRLGVAKVWDAAEQEWQLSKVVVEPQQMRVEAHGYVRTLPVELVRNVFDEGTTEDGFRRVQILLDGQEDLYVQMSDALLEGLLSALMATVESPPGPLAGERTTEPVVATDPGGDADDGAGDSTGLVLTCPYCQTDVVDGPDISCERCHAGYHFDCWNESGGCALPGCTQSTNQPERTPVSPWVPSTAPAPHRPTPLSSPGPIATGAAPSTRDRATSSAATTTSNVAGVARGGAQSVRTIVSRRAARSLVIGLAVIALPIVAVFGTVSGWWSPLTGDFYSADEIAEVTAGARDEGYEVGRSEGYETGRSEGYDEGRSAGYESGRSAGYDEGRSAGYESGRSEGFVDGFEKGCLTVFDVLGSSFAYSSSYGYSSDYVMRSGCYG